MWCQHQKKKPKLVIWNLHRKPYICIKRPHNLVQMPQDEMINCRITCKNRLQANILMVYPKRPAPQGNHFLCSLSLYITHPSFGHQFQLFTQCQVYFQVSTFLLCHCIFPFSCNVLALHLLAFQAGSNVKCVWGPERVFWFLGGFLTHIFCLLCLHICFVSSPKKSGVIEQECEVSVQILWPLEWRGTN